MSSEDELKLFDQRHPHPERVGVSSLFRFSKANLPLEYLELLLVEGKLFHSLPTQFNDPFECKPHFRWPNKAKEVRKIRQYLVKIARDQGMKKKIAETVIARGMAQPGFIEEAIYGAVNRTLSEVRICSFTSSKENLLFWAHYADSHRGFCVEYDATVLPISYAFKVHYSSKYPEIKYPPPKQTRNLEPVLIKSDDWQYEEEFRTILIPTSARQPKNDGTSIILSGQEIKNIYLGAYMEEDHKQLILELIRKGPFKPGIWQSSLAQSEFKLDFRSL